MTIIESYETALMIFHVIGERMSSCITLALPSIARGAQQYRHGLTPLDDE